MIKKIEQMIATREPTPPTRLAQYVGRRVGDALIDVGSWTVPVCYQEKCRRLEARDTFTYEQEECIVAGVAEIALGSLQGRLRVDLRTLHELVQSLRPEIHDVDYSTVRDPHTAEVLEKILPLHEDNV